MRRFQLAPEAILAFPFSMAAIENHSSGRLVGLLVMGIIILAFTGLFGTWYAHETGARALERADHLASLIDAARRTQIDFKTQVQLWKNLLLRGQDSAEFQKYWRSFEAQQQLVQKDLQNLQETDELPEGVRTELAEIKSDHAMLNATYEAALKEYMQDEPTSIFRIDAKVKDTDQALNERLDAVAYSLVEESAKQLDALQEENAESYRLLRFASVSLTLITVAVAIVLGWRASRPRLVKAGS